METFIGIASVVILLFTAVGAGVGWTETKSGEPFFENAVGVALLGGIGAMAGVSTMSVLGSVFYVSLMVRGLT